MSKREPYILGILTIAVFLTACGATAPAKEITEIKKAMENKTATFPLPEKKPAGPEIAQLLPKEPLDIFSCNRNERARLISVKPYHRYKTLFDTHRKYRWGGKIAATGKVSLESGYTMSGKDSVIFSLQKPAADDTMAMQFFENQMKPYSTGNRTFVFLGVMTGNLLDTTAKVSRETAKKIIESAGKETPLTLTLYFGPDEYEFGLPDNYSEACRIES